MEDLKHIVAKNITALRMKNGMTQLELGEKLSYSDKSVSKWERGESVPDAFVLKEIGKMFGVTVDYLLTDHDIPTEPAPWEKHETVAEAIVKNVNEKVQNNHKFIVTISLAGVWTIAILIFFIIWAVTGKMYWLTFIFMLPVSFIVSIVFNSIWGVENKRLMNAVYISGLVLSVFACIYFAFLSLNLWMIFILMIPAEVIIYFSFKIHRNKDREKNKDNKTD